MLYENNSLEKKKLKKTKTKQNKENPFTSCSTETASFFHKSTAVLTAPVLLRNPQQFTHFK